jgi:hypothetical protein
MCLVFSPRCSPLSGGTLTLTVAGFSERLDDGGDVPLVGGRDEDALTLLFDAGYGTPLKVHPLKPSLIMPLRTPAAMPSNLFHAPIHDMID